MTSVAALDPSNIRVANVEAFIIAGEKDYVAGAGLRPADATPRNLESRSRERHRVLHETGDLHVCAYPPHAQTCLVRLVAEDGTVGWGEAHAPLGPRATKAIIEDVLAPVVIGENPLAIERHWERMYGTMRLRGHIAGYQLEAIAGVDIALWDLAGKLLGMPICRLLGGPFRTRLPAYASGVPGRTVEERIAAARQFLSDGYTAMKISIGRGNLDAELKSVAAVAESLRGEADLLVDAHGAYSVEQALIVGKALQEMGVYWFEDPLPPEAVNNYVQLSTALDMPVAAGETECTRWQVETRLAQGAVDIILPDVCRAGGITEGRRIATVASLHNTKWAAHVSMGSSIHVAAAAHLAAASSNFLILEFSSTPNPIGERLLTAPLHPENGILQVPEGPGLGILFDETQLHAHIIRDPQAIPVVGG